MATRVVLDDFNEVPSRELGQEAPAWIIDAAELLAEPDPGPTPWLIEDLIVDGALVAAVGRWKTTKSYGILDMSISIATGRPAFGTFAVPDPGPVVFVNEESGRAALWRRLDWLCRGRAVDPEELRGRLFVAPNVGVKLDDDNWQQILVELGHALEPRLFVFDPLARTKGSTRKESAQDEMGPVIEFWRRLRQETGSAVALVHHTGHQGEHMRGSSDLESAWDTRILWKREKGSPIVTIESEHREAEDSAEFKYRISWDGVTRSIRFEATEDELARKVRLYLDEHPDASANEVDEAMKGTKGTSRKKVLELVRTIKEGGSTGLEPPRTTPHGPMGGGGSTAPPFRAAGTTPPDPLAEVVLQQWNHHYPELLDCVECGGPKGAKVVAGVTYFVCGHQRVDA